MRYLFLSIALTCFTIWNLQAQKRQQPDLVVTVVVDQMRWDYLYRYFDRFSEHGFRRLMSEGFLCENTFINHIPSYTAPGHATVYTGTVPAIHGITGNDWYDNITGRSWYCVEDTLVQPVGGSGNPKKGKMSPRNLLSSTITDELKLATQMRSKVFAIAIKDRGSILPAGHLADGAFWYDDLSGSLITSTYYTDTLPKWLNKFNARKLPDTYLRNAWKTLYPIESYIQSTTDSNAYEGDIGDKQSYFPHRTKIQSSPSYQVLKKIPAGNTYTFEAAKACILGNSLGRGKDPDFIAISLSATDYIGHIFNPNSVEVEDTYLRLDLDIADFLEFLDEYAGEGNYLLMLTADHGVSHNADYMRDIGMPAGNDSERKLFKELKKYVKEQLGHDSLILAVENYQIFFHEDKIRQNNIDRNHLKQLLTNWLHTQPQIAYVLDMDHPEQWAVPSLVKTMATHGYHRMRSGVLWIIHNPGWYFGYAQTGTSHSNWHAYDTHIPLIWYGKGVRRGKTYQKVHMEDIAPTLAALLQIQMPNGTIGKVISAVIEE